MLRRARKIFFNNNTIAILKIKIVAKIRIYNLDKQIVIVQQNAT